MIRKYNTVNKWLGRIQDDFEGLTLAENEVKLSVSIQPPPTYDPETQRIEKVIDIDLDIFQYIEAWITHQLTEAEIDEMKWEGGELQIRIIAPIELVLTDFGAKMKSWFEINQLPIIPKGEQVHLYCNQIREDFLKEVQPLIEQQIISIESKQK